ncbi:MAG TPA: hypothetical protein VFE21_09355 [Rubrobacteraceae bacterium]|nr:hypothetical protein [Rubrobacteraceae bacterium]
MLYAGLCSFAGHREINRKDLRNVLKGSTDEEINEAFEELIRRNLLEPSSRGFAIYAVGKPAASEESATP